MNAYFDGLRRYADFTGRSTRSQYWFFMLGYFVVGLVGIFIDAASSSGEPSGVVTGLISLAHLLPSWAVLVRRLHDTDRSGWWILIALIPLVGAITLIVFCCTPSQPRANRFGPPVAPLVPGAGFDLNSYRQPDFGAFEPAPAVHGQRVEPVTRRTAPVSTALAPAIDEGAMIERLERLAALRASGAIDDAEFAQMKASALQQGRSVTGASL